MKIFAISHTGLFAGGAERSFFYFLKGTPLKDEILVLVPFYVKDGLYDKLKDSGIKAKIIEKDKTEIPFNEYRRNPFIIGIKVFKRLIFGIKYAFFLIKENPDVVYINTMRCATEAMFSKLFGKKVIYHIRGLDGGWKFRLPLLKFTADKIITVASSEKEALENAGYKREIIVIPNGIDTSIEIKKKKHKGIVILNIANIEYRKGTDIFLEIAKKILDLFDKDKKNKEDKKNQEEIEFWQVGRIINEPSPWFENLKKQYSIYLKKIKFFGYQENTFDFLRKADIFLFPSRQEGSPRVVLEAMLAGLPVVSFNRDGQKDIIVNGETGFLVENEEEMLEKTILLIKDKNLRIKFGINAKKRVKDKFNIESNIQKITKALTDVISR